MIPNTYVPWWIWTKMSKRFFVRKSKQQGKCNRCERDIYLYKQVKMPPGIAVLATSYQHGSKEEHRACMMLGEIVQGGRL